MILHGFSFRGQNTKYKSSACFERNYIHFFGTSKKDLKKLSVTRLS